jgi:hypothetical protein
MNLSVTVTLLLCTAAFCVGLAVRALWAGRPVADDSTPTVAGHGDEPYPLWFE